MEYLKEFGKNIKKRRLELGMTLEEVAKLTGYSGKSGVAKVESGYSNVYQDMVLYCSFPFFCTKICTKILIFVIYLYNIRQ